MVAVPGHDARALEDALGDTFYARPDVWLGGWRDARGVWHIEPAINLADRSDALMLGRLWDQVSVWDVTAAREIDPRGALQAA